MKTIDVSEEKRLGERFLGSQQAFLSFPNPKTIDPTKPRKQFMKVICGGWGSGKAVSLDTIIPTPDGFVKMREIKVGGRVYDENGNECNVTGVSPVMHDRPCYEVEFDNGEVVVADKEHEWKTIHIGDRDRHVRQVLKKGGVWGKDVFTTEEIKRTLIYNDSWKTKTHAVKLVSIKGEEKELPIHPYVLGAWLGDGDSHAGYLTAAESEIPERIANFGYNVIKSKEYADKAARYRIEGLTTTLRTLGLYKNKHIPRVYRRASFEQRLWLLKGLMDTDGFACRQSGSCEYTSISEKLAFDVYELIQSLGIKATIKCGLATISHVFKSVKWRIHFVAEFPVFNLQRKRDRQHGSTFGRNWKRSIVDVRETASVPVRCIEVDSPSHLYCISRSFIPTHNSYAGIVNGLMLSAMFPGNEGLVGRFHGKDLEDSIIPLFFQICPESWIARVQNRGKTGMTVRLINGSIIYFRHIHDAGGGATKSRRVGANLGWFFLSQIEEMTEGHWQTLMGRLRNPKAGIKMGMGDANPNGRDWVQRTFFPNWKPLNTDGGEFFRSYQKGNILGIHVDSEENRELNGGFIQDDYFDNLIANMSPDWVNRYIHGSFEDFSGKVYKGYTFDSVHNIDPIAIPRHWECTVSIDVGGSCPWGVVVSYTDECGNIVVTDSLSRVTSRTSEIAEWIKNHCPWNEARTTFIIDPENKLAAGELSDLGIYCRIAQKQVHQGTLRTAGYFHVRKGEELPAWFRNTQDEKLIEKTKLHGVPRLFVVKENIAWRREHDEVVWDDKRPNTIKKTHEKRYDLVDATRYICAVKPDASQLPRNQDPYSELREVSMLAAREMEATDRELEEMKAQQDGRGTREMFNDWDYGENVGVGGDWRDKGRQFDWN
jgi:hypothetical protein